MNKIGLLGLLAIPFLAGADDFLLGNFGSNSLNGCKKPKRIREQNIRMNKRKKHKKLK